jgi:hypothetical protein
MKSMMVGTFNFADETNTENFKTLMNNAKFPSTKRLQNFLNPQVDLDKQDDIGQFLFIAAHSKRNVLIHSRVNYYKFIAHETVISKKLKNCILAEFERLII